MNHDNANENHGDDEDTAASASGDLGPSVTRTPQKLRRRRQQRIEDYMCSVLDSPDPLHAVMGPMLCDIVGMSENLKSLWDERIRRSAAPAAGLKEAMPLLESYLKSVRQAERLANVECRIRESQTCRLQAQNDRSASPEEITE